MPRLAISVSCTLLLSLTACGQDEQLPVPSLAPPIVAGGLCSSSASQCLDDSRILVCENRIWTERTCAEACAERGRLAHGCRTEEFDATCLCVAPDAGAGADATPSECSYTLRRCADSETLVVCTSGRSVQRSCSAICAELSPPRLSLGCRPYLLFARLGVDECVCSLAGTACVEDSAPICDGAGYVARCVDGLWQIEDCALVCAPDGGSRCSSWQDDGGAGCSCGD
jgi:hypothetical protein